MKRYFQTSAALAAVLLVASFLLGIVFLYHQRAGGMSAPRMDQPLHWDWFTAHMAISLAAALFTLFVHCLVFTYLLGTGKWVKEVASAYGLPADGYPRQTKEFKVRVNRIMLAAMALVIMAAVSGAGSQNPTSWWATAHPVFAVLVLFANAWAFVVEYRVILANEVVLNQVKAEADRMRAAQGAMEE
jgi:hypothetical protein